MPTVKFQNKYTATIRLAVGKIFSPDTCTRIGIPRYAMFAKTNAMKIVRRKRSLSFSSFPAIKAKRNSASINAELTAINGACSANEKGALVSEVNIKAGNPILRANSLRTVCQLSPMTRNRCNKAPASMMRNNGAIAEKIWIMIVECRDAGEINQWVCIKQFATKSRRHEENLNIFIKPPSVLVSSWQKEFQKRSNQRLLIQIFNRSFRII